MALEEGELAVPVLQEATDDHHLPYRDLGAELHAQATEG
jgi:hypothetical protein